MRTASPTRRNRPGVTPDRAGRALRPRVRARRLRRRVRRAAGRRRARTRRSQRAITGAREPRAPRRRRRRPEDRRRRGDPAAAAGRALPRRRRRRAAAAPGSTASRVCFLPRDDAERRAELEQLLVDDGRGRGPAGRLLARRAGRPRRTSATPRRAVAPLVKQLVVAASARPRRRPGRVRAQALRDPPRRRARRRARPRSSRASRRRRSSTRGC